MTKLLLILLFSFSFSIDRLTNDKQEDIFELVQVIHDESIDTIFQNIFQYISMFGNDDIKWDLLKSDLIKIMDLNEYYMLYVPFFDENFTHSEIKDILRFNKSDTGRKLNSLAIKMSVDETERTIKYFEDWTRKAKDIIGQNKGKYIITKDVFEKKDIPEQDNSLIKSEKDTTFTFIPYDDPPVPKTAIRPKYPKKARDEGIEGIVYVHVFVNEKGRVKEASITKGIPNSGLDEAAMEALFKTKFRPAKSRGKPVGVYLSIPVSFRLKN